MSRSRERAIPLSEFKLHHEIYVRLHRELRSGSPLYLPPGPTFRIRLGASNITFPEPPLEGLSLMDFSDPLNVTTYFVSWEDIEYNGRDLTYSEFEYYMEVLNPAYGQNVIAALRNGRREKISCIVDPEAVEAYRDRIGEVPRTYDWAKNTRKPRAA